MRRVSSYYITNNVWGGLLMAAYEKVTEYEDEPVKYCPRCLSLKIKYEELSDTEYCGDCGCSDVLEASFEDWERKYEARYGHKFVEKGKDIRKHPIFQLTIKELKNKLYDSDNWEKVVRAMYPTFPQGYSKIDSILLFFDKLIRENQLDEFRILLTKIKL